MDIYFNAGHRHRIAHSHVVTTQHDRNTGGQFAGYSVPQTTDLFENMVAEEGFEPPTHGL